MRARSMLLAVITTAAVTVPASGGLARNVAATHDDPRWDIHTVEADGTLSEPGKGHENVDIIRSTARMDFTANDVLELTLQVEGTLTEDYYVYINTDYHGRSINKTPAGTAFITGIEQGGYTATDLFWLDRETQWYDRYVPCDGLRHTAPADDTWRVEIPRSCLNDPSRVWVSWAARSTHADPNATASQYDSVPQPQYRNGAQTIWWGPIGFLPDPSGPYATATAAPTGSICDGRDQPRFSDVPATNPHADAINCLADYGIALGKGDGTYAPAGTLTWGQTASFIARTLETSGHPVPAGSDTCEGAAGTHEPTLEALHDASVIPPLGPDLIWCDGSSWMTREQMAAWVTEAARHAGLTPDTGTDFFPDDDSLLLEPHVNGVASLGIVTGKTDGTYAPFDRLRRDQMATFLVRLLALAS